MQEKTVQETVKLAASHTDDEKKMIGHCLQREKENKACLFKCKQSFIFFFFFF